MRVYKDFKEAKNEIARDLNELGTTVFAGYQSKSIEDMTETERELLTTKELQDYDYVVLQPSFDDVEPTQPWADAEWAERLEGIEHRARINPGEAWKLREEVWQPLIEPHRGGFSYSYNERFYDQDIRRMAVEMGKNPSSRQIYISIWDPQLDTVMAGRHRVPCTLGYQLKVRGGKMEIAYIMRSSDFDTHFDNDLFMAMKLQGWFADHLGVPTGRFVHKIGSLHTYAANVAHVF